MPQRTGDNSGKNDNRRLIRTREDVVVTSSQDPRSGRPVFYVKVNDTGEIFEFQEDEYNIWKEFSGGASLEAAERAAEMRFGSGFREKLRTFVADLAMRGLLGGDLPPDLVEEFAQDSQPGVKPFLIDPNERLQRHSWYRFVLMDPNAFFGVLARWFAFARYLHWPLTFAAFVAVLVLFKHAQNYSADFHATILQWSRIPHAVFTLFSINLSRVIAQGAVSRYYGARVRYLSIDLVYGVWPRFHEDKRGILALERTPQLWSHSTPFFVRLAYFSFGTLLWWWLRGNGSHLSQYCLLASQAAIADFVTATLPLFKNETYFWFCAFHRDPVLQERGKAALRSMFFLAKGTPRYLSPIEKLALALYGLSMLITFLALMLVITVFVVGLTGTYQGFGFSICLILLVMGATKAWTIRSLKRQLLTAKLERRAERRLKRFDQLQRSQA